jgi:hypothetical protein
MALGLTDSARGKVYVVACKRCKRYVLSGCEKFPVYPIVVDCPLCGEKRRYRPSEVYLGKPDAMVTRQWMF